MNADLLILSLSLIKYPHGAIEDIRKESMRLIRRCDIVGSRRKTFRVTALHKFVRSRGGVACKGEDGEFRIHIDRV